MKEITKEQMEQFIPLDKSWVIRMGVLDILNGYNDIVPFLEKQTDLGGDLKALKRVAEKWNTDEPLDVGESGTICRFVSFALWKLRMNRKVIKSGTLEKREICQNPEIVNWPIEKLLTLDGGTSQWATMSVLLGNQEKPAQIPYFMTITYDAIEHWNNARKEGKVWEARKDPTIMGQTLAFLKLLAYGRCTLEERDLSDCDLYCFLRAFNFMSKEEGEKIWPHIKYHETDRLEGMEIAIALADKDGTIDSNDHRIVQAMVMRQIFLKKPYTVKDPNAVNKTWPKFWEFIELVKKRSGR